MRSTVLILALLSGGCLVEYVLPGAGTTAVTTTGDSLPTGDPTEGTATAADAASNADAETSATTDPSETAGPATQTTGGDPSSDGEPCGDGQTRCGDACVDLRVDEAHCGDCFEVCKTDELCIAAQCRDVLPVECNACPCEACPMGDGLLAATTGDGGGDGGDGGGDGGSDGGSDPQQYLCCAPAEGEKALCIVGDLDDVLVCPAE